MDIHDGEGLREKVPYLVIGLICTLSGVSIYFLMPLAVLTLNLGLLLEIFFLILVGMIFGLSMIALNFQSITEIFFCETLLFYEKRSMKNLI